MSLATSPRDHGSAPATRSEVQRIGRSAIAALYDELALDVKPGLVSFVDSGSHRDMDAGTFMRSLFALRRYFAAIAGAGARDAGFTDLERLGIEAEGAMLRATRGINTHRGAIFSVGLLCAAAGRLQASGARPAPGLLRHHLLEGWGTALRERCNPTPNSHGQRAARRYGLRSVGEEAALGFPVLFEITLPALQRARSLGLDDRRCRLQALLATVATLDDTNLAHRGGLRGLRWAQQRASDWLAAGGAAHPDAIRRARVLHAEFVVHRLSPGGSADVLAAACWWDRWSRHG